MIDAIKATTYSAEASLYNATDRFTGYFLACAMPAMFWTMILSLGGTALGVTISATALLTAGLAVTAFLASVFGALTLNPKR